MMARYKVEKFDGQSSSASLWSVDMTFFSNSKSIIQGALFEEKKSIFDKRLRRRLHLSKFIALWSFGVCGFYILVLVSSSSIAWA